MSTRHLDCLLEPCSVAVLGASDRLGSVGSTVWRNLRAGDFAGPVYPVSPAHERLDSAVVFSRPSDLPQAPDLAILCRPPNTVAPLVAELGGLGTRAAIVMTPGLDARPHSTLPGPIWYGCSAPTAWSC